MILNNRRYAALQDFAPVFGFSEGEIVQGTDLADLDFVSLARGMGCDAIRVNEPDRLRAALTKALSARAPMLVEVVVS